MGEGRGDKQIGRSGPAAFAIGVALQIIYEVDDDGPVNKTGQGD